MSGQRQVEPAAPGALSNILGQIFARRRGGAWSLLAGFCLAPLWQVYKRLVRRPIMARTWMGAYIMLDPDSVTASRFVYEGEPDREVLKGAGGHFARGGIRIGLFECHTDDTLRGVLALLAPLGYKVFDGPREIVAAGVERSRDLFFVRGDLAQAYRRCLTELIEHGATAWRTKIGSGKNVRDGLGQ